MIPLLLLSLLAADPTPPAPVFNGREGGLKVRPPRVEAEIVVDGVLDEPVWQQAARLSGFSQYFPVDGRAAEDRTEVLVWYSPTAIHFGIQAEAVAGSVRASLANRDKIDSDDYVQIFLSTFNDGRQAWLFAVNPLGVQADGTLVEGTGTGRGSGGFSSLLTEREPPDLSADFVFESRGRLTEAGYEVEVKIPFKSLRFPAADTQDWGLHVVRRIQSSGHEDSWAPARRAAASFLGQSGTLEGLTDLRPGLVLDLTPILTQKVDGAPSGDGWDYHAGKPQPGGNVRWGVTSNLTLNGTFNPDFSQVESDAQQFTYDPRIAVFYPEKRPFFLDNGELFTTPNQLIYTRRIVDPDAAVKLTGRLAGTTLATLFAVDGSATSSSGDDHPIFGILRAQRDVGKGSKVALVYTDRTESDHSNRVLAGDARFTWGEIYSLQLQGAASRTRDAGAAAVIAPLWQAIANRNGRKFGFRYLFTGIDQDFRAESGFISRPGIVQANADHRRTFFGKPGALLESLSCDVVLDGIWRYRDFVEGRGLLEKKLHFNNNAVLRGGWKAGASVLVESFGYDPDLYADYALLEAGPDGPTYLPFTGTPSLPNLDFVLDLETPQFSKFSGTAQVLWGKDENFFEWSSADILYLTFTADWRPTEKLRVSAQYQHQQFDRRTDGSTVGVRKIPRLKLEYQLSRSLFLRAVGEYDAARQDDLRDDSRTELPIVIRDPATGEYAPALASLRNRLRLDFLFAYQPRPGTVFFAGYGSTLAKGLPAGPPDLQRETDGFFFKISYLFRL
jgi:hypothetical protein